MTPKRTPISYYGGKGKMLKHILPLIPEHRIYTETYVGGGAVFFAKGPAFLSVLNDIDGNTMNFYTVMKTRFEELNNLIEISLFDENSFRQASLIIKSPKSYSKLKRAWAYWFITNLSFSNKIGGGIKFDNGSRGSHFGRTFNNKVEEFKYYADRLKEVQLQSRPALEIIESRNFVDAFHFLDPPYPRADQGHYAKTQFTIERFVELLTYLETKLKGKFMLCNYWQPELEDFLERNPHWNIYKFDMRLSAAHEKAKKTRKIEIIITNYLNNPKLF